MPAKRTENQTQMLIETAAKRLPAQRSTTGLEAIGAIVARMFSGPVQKIRGGDLGDVIPAPGNDTRGGGAVTVQDRKRPASR